VTSNSVGVFTTDRDLVVQVWDPALARLTRINSAQASGRSLVALIPDLGTRGLIKHFRRTLQEGVVTVLAPAFHRYLIGCPPLTPSPRFKEMRQHVTIAPLEQDGEIAGLIVTLEDITPRLDRERDAVDRLARVASLDNKELVRELDDAGWRLRQRVVEEVAHRAAPDAIAALLISVRDNHLNLGLLNSALTVLRSSNVDIHSALIEFLTGPDADLRMQASLALGEQKDVRAIPYLLDALSDANPNVVYHAIEALGKLRAQESIDALLGIAESKDFFLAFPALEALGAIGNSIVAPRLLPLLQDEMLREPAVLALARVGDEFTVEAFVRILNERDAPTEMIARALAILYDRYETLYGEGAYIAGLCGRSIRPLGVQNLIGALAKADQENLRPLVLLLGCLDSPAAARVVTRHLGHPELRNEILAALVRHGSAVTELLMEQLDSEDLEVRWSAVTALGRIKDRRATPALAKLLGEDEELTIPLIGSLTSIGDPSAIDALFGLLGTPDAAVRKATVGALNALGPPEMVDRVIRLLSDPNPGVREAGVRISGYFGYRQCMETLFSLCRDADENVRRAAVEHLPFLDSDRTPKLLSEALREDLPAVRAAAAAAMAHLKPSEAVPDLIRALNDEDPWVRYFAARSLDRHGASEAASALHRLAQEDKFQQVRIAAFEALSNIDEALAAPLARFFGSSVNPDFRRAAAMVVNDRNGTP
jgi:HEAT repeat protein